jgi:hypothetical protein
MPDHALLTALAARLQGELAARLRGGSLRALARETGLGRELICRLAAGAETRRASIVMAAMSLGLLAPVAQPMALASSPRLTA